MALPPAKASRTRRAPLTAAGDRAIMAGTREDLSNATSCGTIRLCTSWMRPRSVTIHGSRMPIDLVRNDTYTTLSAMIAPAIFLTANAA